MANNYKLTANAVSDFSCSGCSDFNDYLTKANIPIDDNGFFNLDDITTRQNVRTTWAIDNLTNRYTEYYTDDDRATYNRFLKSDFSSLPEYGGTCKINGFQINGETSPEIVLRGTIPTFGIGFEFPGSPDYYYAIQRTNTTIKAWTLNRGTNTVNTSVKLFSYWIRPTANTNVISEHGVNSVTFTAANIYTSTMPFRAVTIVQGGGGAGGNGTYWLSGGGGGSGACVGGILDFLAANNTYHIYVGDGGSPGETGGSGGETTVYGFDANGSPYVVANVGGGGGGGPQSGGGGSTTKTNNFPWGLIGLESNGTEKTISLSVNGTAGGKNKVKGSDFDWGSTTNLYGTPHTTTILDSQGHVLTKSSGGPAGSWSGGGGASGWKNGGNPCTGWEHSYPDGAQGSGGGGLPYGGQLTSDMNRKHAGYGGKGFVNIYF